MSGAVDLTAKWREGADRRVIKLSDLPGCRPWRLSDEARREIEAIERNHLQALRQAPFIWFD